MKLEELAVKYGTDKQIQNGHGYTKFYEMYFDRLRNQNIKLLELGVREGWSVNMWLEYFPKAEIWCIDNDKEGLCPKSFENKRVNFYLGSQDDEEFLDALHEKSGDFDIIIDDASHISKLSIKSFQILFKYLKSGGLYIIEDLHVCNLPEYNPDGFSTIRFFQSNYTSGIKNLSLYINKIMFIEKE